MLLIFSTRKHYNMFNLFVCLEDCSLRRTMKALFLFLSFDAFSSVEIMVLYQSRFLETRSLNLKFSFIVP